MAKKLKYEIECPYCNKTMGKQGIYGHIRGNHPGMEDDYRTRFPPKMTSLKPSKTIPDTPEPIKKQEPEESMSNEKDDILNEPEPVKEEPKPEPKPEPVKEEPKSEPKKEPVVVVPAGDKEPSKKAKSFLDDLFDLDDII